MTLSYRVNEKIHRIPLREQVAQLIREEIHIQFEIGQQLEPDVKLAKRFGVSLLTIRETMSALAQEGIVERIHGKGTFVSKRKAQQHVALVLGVGGGCFRETYYWTRMTEQLQLFLGASGIQSRVYWARSATVDQETDPSYAEFMQNTTQNDICGVVFIRWPVPERWRKLLQASRVPVVGRGTAYAVNADYSELVREGTRCLLEAGRKKIAFLGWLDPRNPEGKELYRKAFQEALSQYGGQIRERWFASDLHPNWAGAGYAGFKEIWTAESEKPDGLLVTDDVLFADAVPAILEIGVRVPEQLMVATYANKGSGILYPFPTIRMEYDLDDIARRQGGILLRLMRKEAVAPAPVCVPFRWVEKEAVIGDRSSVISTSP